MPLFDKIKAQVAEVGKMAQSAGQAGQAKLDQVQAKRKLDALYRDLGEAEYHRESGQADADNASTISRLVEEITQHIADNGAGAGVADDDGGAAAPTTTVTDTPPPATNAPPPGANYGGSGSL